MATLQYSGYRGGTTSLNNSPSLSLSKSAGDISNYRIDSIIANIYLSTNAYSKTYAVQVDITGASGTAYVKLNADNYTGGWVQVWLTASAGFNPNSIQAMVVSCSTDGDKIFLKSNTMTVDVNWRVRSAHLCVRAGLRRAGREHQCFVVWRYRRQQREHFRLWRFQEHKSKWQL